MSEKYIKHSRSLQQKFHLVISKMFGLNLWDQGNNCKKQELELE